MGYLVSSSQSSLCDVGHIKHPSSHHSPAPLTYSNLQANSTSYSTASHKQHTHDFQNGIIHNKCHHRHLWRSPPQTHSPVLNNRHPHEPQPVHPSQRLIFQTRPRPHLPLRPNLHARQRIRKGLPARARRTTRPRASLPRHLAARNRPPRRTRQLRLW